MEYKFRGKRKDNGEWVYGLLVMGVFNDTMIQTHENGFYSTVVVIPETVGLWTGLVDKAGKDIYQGDVYLAERGHMRSRGYKRKGYPETIKVTCIVEWSIYDAGWNGREVSPIKEHIEFDKNATYHYIFTSLSGSQNGHADWVEVIGNITDHPHFLNPASGQSGINNMLDPNEKQAAEGQEATTETLESASQDKAMEVDSEEGTTEG